MIQAKQKGVVIFMDMIGVSIGFYDVPRLEHVILLNPRKKLAVYGCISLFERWVVF